MKPIYLAAICAAAISPSARASTGDDSAEICNTFGEVAEAVMTARQDGALMGDVIARWQQMPGATDGAMELLRALVIDAYKVPQFGSDEVKAETIREFRNSNELFCWQQF